jgi:hypothetical protein
VSASLSSPGSLLPITSNPTGNPLMFGTTNTPPGATPTLSGNAASGSIFTAPASGTYQFYLCVSSASDIVTNNNVVISSTSLQAGLTVTSAQQKSFTILGAPAQATTMLGGTPTVISSALPFTGFLYQGDTVTFSAYLSDTAARSIEVPSALTITQL